MLGCKRVGEQEGRSTNGVTVWRRGCFQMEKTGMYLRAEGREPIEGRKLLECGPLGDGLVGFGRKCATCSSEEGGEGRGGEDGD